MSLRDQINRQKAEKHEIVEQRGIAPKEQPALVANLPATVPSPPAPTLTGLAALRTGKLSSVPTPQKPEAKNTPTPFVGTVTVPAGSTPIKTSVPVIAAPTMPIEIAQDFSPDSVEALRKNLEYLAQNIDQRNLVSQIVRTIAIQLRKNRHFKNHMVNADFDLIVRGLRSSFTVVKRQKTEKIERKNAKTAEVLELENMMKDMGVKFDFGE